jgi:RNA recognition motif-containing protein
MKFDTTRTDLKCSEQTAEMTTQKPLREDHAHRRSCERGRVIWLGNINFSSSRDSVGEFIKSSGFGNAITLWPPNVRGQHSGWCQVQFRSKVIANKAIQDLNGKQLNGRGLLTRKQKPWQDAPVTTAARAAAQTEPSNVCVSY